VRFAGLTPFRSVTFAFLGFFEGDELGLWDESCDRVPDPSGK
jgi:hypothetical protein